MARAKKTEKKKKKKKRKKGRKKKRKKEQSQTMAQSQYPQSSHDTTFDEEIFWRGQPMANDLLFKWESMAE
jgi:hypothetical protein